MVKAPASFQYGVYQLEVVYIESPTSFWVNYADKKEELELVTLAVQVSNLLFMSLFRGRGFDSFPTFLHQSTVLTPQGNASLFKSHRNECSEVQLQNEAKQALVA